MSPRASDSKGKSKGKAKRATEDPSPDVYVGLLFVSVGALMTGCILLAMELSANGWKIN